MQMLDIKKLLLLMIIFGTSFVSNAEHDSRQLTANKNFHCSLSKAGEILCWGVGCEESKNLNALDFGTKGFIKEISLEANRVCAITESSSKSQYINCKELKIYSDGKSCEYSVGEYTPIASKALKVQKSLSKVVDGNEFSVKPKLPSNNFSKLKSYTHDNGESITCFIVSRSDAVDGGQLWCRGKFKKSGKFDTTFPVLKEYYKFSGHSDYRYYEAEKWYYNIESVLDNVKDYVVTNTDLCILDNQNQVKCLENFDSYPHFRFSKVSKNIQIDQIKIANKFNFNYRNIQTANSKRKRYLISLDRNNKVRLLNDSYVLPQLIENNSYNNITLTDIFACASRVNDSHVDCWKRTSRTEAKAKTYDFGGVVKFLSSSEKVVCAVILKQGKNEVHCLNPTTEFVTNTNDELFQLNGKKEVNKIVKIIGKGVSILTKELYDVWLNKEESPLALTLLGEENYYNENLIEDDLSEIAIEIQDRGISLTLATSGDLSIKKLQSLNRLTNLTKLTLNISSSFISMGTPSIPVEYRRLTLEEILDLDYRRVRDFKNTSRVKMRLAEKSVGSLVGKSDGVLKNNQNFRDVISGSNFDFGCNMTNCDPVYPLMGGGLGDGFDNPQLGGFGIPNCDPRFCDPVGPIYPDFPITLPGGIECTTIACITEHLRSGRIRYGSRIDLGRHEPKYIEENWSLANISELNSLRELKIVATISGMVSALEIDFKQLEKFSKLEKLSVRSVDHHKITGLRVNKQKGTVLTEALGSSSIKELEISAPTNCAAFVSSIKSAPVVTKLSLDKCSTSPLNMNEWSSDDGISVDLPQYSISADFSGFKKLRTVQFSSGYQLFYNNLGGLNYPLIDMNKAYSQKIDLLETNASLEKITFVGNIDLKISGLAHNKSLKELVLRNNIPKDTAALLDISNLEAVTFGKLYMNKFEELFGDLEDQGVKVKFLNK